MKNTLLSLPIALLPLLAACTSPEKNAGEPAAVMVSTDETEEQLDPNDPNVMVCPVTGAMQRIQPGEDGYHATGDRDDGSY